MRTSSLNVGARGIDCLQSIDAAHALALKKSGIDFVVRYLTSVTPDELSGILGAGLGFMPVTFANAWDGNKAVAQCRALGLSPNVSVWLDVEGKDVWTLDPDVLMANVNGWASPVRAAQFMPCLYVGNPQPLTSSQLYSMSVVRYWKGQGRTVDRTGALAEPTCGWSMWQMFPSQMWSGVWVDVNIVGQDYQRRLPCAAFL